VEGAAALLCGADLFVLRTYSRCSYAGSSPCCRTCCTTALPTGAAFWVASCSIAAPHLFPAALLLARHRARCRHFFIHHAYYCRAISVPACAALLHADPAFCCWFLRSGEECSYLVDLWLISGARGSVTSYMATYTDWFRVVRHFNYAATQRTYHRLPCRRAAAAHAPRRALLALTLRTLVRLCLLLPCHILLYLLLHVCVPSPTSSVLYFVSCCLALPGGRTADTVSYRRVHRKTATTLLCVRGAKRVA